MPDLSPAQPKTAAALSPSTMLSQLESQQKAGADEIGKIEKTYEGKQKDIVSQMDALRPPEMTPPPAPTVKSTDPTHVWGSVAMLMAGLGSLLTRQPLTTAMNAAAGVMHAYRKGDQEAADAAYQTWKVASDNAIKLHDFQQSAYKDALEGLKNREGMNKEERDGAVKSVEARLKALATSFQDNIMLQHLNLDDARLGMEGQRLKLEMEHILDDRQKFAAEMTKMAPELERARIEQGAYSELKKDPKFVNAAPMEQLKMLRSSGITIDPKHEEAQANVLLKDVMSSQPAKSYGQIQEYGPGIEAAAGKLSRGEKLDSQDQAALQDASQKIMTGGNAIRGFLVKLNTDHAGLGDKAQIAMQQAGKGGNLSPDMANSLVRLIHEYEKSTKDAYKKVIADAEGRAAHYGIEPDLVRPLGISDEDLGEIRTPAPSNHTLGMSERLPAIESALGGGRVTSFYRSPEHNAAVGGSPTSSHMSGDAYDIAPPQGMSTADAAKKIAADFKAKGIPFDQVIDEGNHVHVGFGEKSRGQVMNIARKGTAHSQFQSVGAVQEAYAHGKISRDEAARVLHEDFGVG